MRVVDPFSHQTNDTPETQPTVSKGRPACRDGFCMTICISNEDVSRQSAANGRALMSCDSRTSDCVSTMILTQKDCG